jgi:hypothetical protein
VEVHTVEYLEMFPITLFNSSARHGGLIPRWDGLYGKFSAS